MKVKAISVRLQALASISDRAYKAVAFDDSEAIIPKSQVMGRDWSVSKSEAWWISEWILGKVDLQHSNKKVAYFDRNTGKMLPEITKTVHKPDRKDPVISKPNKNLLR